MPEIRTVIEKQTVIVTGQRQVGVFRSRELFLTVKQWVCHRICLRLVIGAARPRSGWTTRGPLGACGAAALITSAPPNPSIAKAVLNSAAIQRWVGEALGGQTLEMHHK